MDTNFNNSNEISDISITNALIEEISLQNNSLILTVSYENQNVAESVTLTQLNTLFNGSTPKAGKGETGKVDFVDDGSGTGKTKPVNPVLYDLTPLYYLNNVTNSMEYKSSDDAVKALDTLLDL